MAPQKIASMRLKSRPTLVPFKDDTSFIALRYEKTVQAEPPIPILTRAPPKPLSISTGRTSTSTSSSLSISPYSPVVVAPPPAISQHPAFRLRVTARNTTANDWKRDSGLAPTTSSSATIAEEDCGEEARVYDKIAVLGTNIVAAKSLEEPVAPSVCDIDSVQSTAELAVSKQQSGRCTSPTDKQAATMDQYHFAQLVLTERKASTSSSYSVDSSVELWNERLIGLSPPPPPITPQRQGSLTSSQSSPNLSPVNIPDNHGLLSKDAFGFSPISIPIPTDSLLDDDFLTTLDFSNRGSLMFGGRRVFPAQTTDGTMQDGLQTARARTPALAPAAFAPILHIQYEEPESPVPSAIEPSADDMSVSETITTEVRTPETIAETTAQSVSQVTMTTPSIRVLSADVEMESRKVRSLYESGEGLKWEDGGRPSDVGEHLDATAVRLTGESENDPVAELQHHAWDTPRSGSSYFQRPESRSVHEVAGGLEDWEDLEGQEVDRYGFISPRKAESRGDTLAGSRSSQHVARKRNGHSKRDMFGLGLPSRGPSKKMSSRSLYTQNSNASVTSRRSARSAVRHAGNMLPHNQDRRWRNVAGGMLALSLEDEEMVEKISEAIKKKEWERTEKWRKMAKVVKEGTDGEGMEFEFDVKNQKLIERTWKGIPDRWRASAWYSFMVTHARTQKNSPSEDSIITDFHRLQGRGSPDDVQIDLDVPRTISRHVMFRKRYKGGQRLLFRVLHALSLYFPTTGYVQGMASLAATLLCYFDEEKCFVMLVRMWQLRGLEKLYSPGFDGLMTALNDLQTKWLDGKDVAKKLNELCIDPTAYGTRWYLTLFNLSIPFAAQLRVWDVFLLLGENPSDSPKVPDSLTSMSGIDILHATSAALIHALREVLLDSDFENAMKALTSWIPVKDENILMKVARAEWKSRQKKRF
ncbi:TBC domain-containing protein [Colletotrichum graminicola]|uniref:TBC domain-containing protein n=1 Tax=Colletotrichum graminicola (strain M1.001 / M2 / FGSC 10212) TaxID=645133 RepID=E3QMT0_COLGM|nr:TBC domain-containing protein [Colletotrichum graminicola M1.001]EFQ32168.1 TBC domain-containing protein [Colletotrichum graminicola M1.001]WDK09479.1 TBC domain-containing protein [Colletotrichum graminicola]